MTLTKSKDRQAPKISPAVKTLITSSEALRTRAKNAVATSSDTATLLDYVSYQLNEQVRTLPHGPDRDALDHEIAAVKVAKKSLSGLIRKPHGRK
jgi:hypothetical protein